MDCLFCKMVAGEIPTTVVLDDEDVFAFEDITPQAPVHVLVIPKRHIASIGAMEREHAEVMSKVLLAARQIAEERGIAESGFRCVLNTNDDAGQSVHHVHLHLLGGRRMEWPPG